MLQELIRVDSVGLHVNKGNNYLQEIISIKSFEQKFSMHVKRTARFITTMLEAENKGRLSVYMMYNIYGYGTYSNNDEFFFSKWRFINVRYIYNLIIEMVLFYHQNELC